MTDDAFCGVLGCRKGGDCVIDHPEHGERTVCEGHARGHPVIRYV